MVKGRKEGFRRLGNLGFPISIQREEEGMRRVHPVFQNEGD